MDVKRAVYLEEGFEVDVSLPDIEDLLDDIGLMGVLAFEYEGFRDWLHVYYGLKHNLRFLIIKLSLRQSKAHLTTQLIRIYARAKLENDK